MPSTNRVRVQWSNWIGQPGLSTFYMQDARLDVTPIKNFFTAMAPFVVAPIQWTIPALGDKIDSASGDLVGSWVGTGGGTVSASASNASYAGSAGFVVDWKTATINNNRRIQGRTFFVPGGSSIYQNDGTLVEATRTTIQAAAQALITAMTPDLLIWSRPFPGKAAGPGGVPPAKPPRDGAIGPAVLATVPDIAAVLRSRRS